MAIIHTSFESALLVDSGSCRRGMSQMCSFPGLFKFVEGSQALGGLFSALRHLLLCWQCWASYHLEPSWELQLQGWLVFCGVRAVRSVPLGCALSEPVLTPCAFLLVANVLCPVRVVEHSDCISVKSHSRLCCPSWSFVKRQHFSNRHEVFLALGSLWRNWTKSSDGSLCVCQNCSQTFTDILGTERSARMLCCKADAVWGTPNSRITAIYLNFFIIIIWKLPMLWGVFLSVLGPDSPSSGSVISGADQNRDTAIPWGVPWPGQWESWQCVTRLTLKRESRPVISGKTVQHIHSWQSPSSVLWGLAL